MTYGGRVGYWLTHTRFSHTMFIFLLLQVVITRYHVYVQGGPKNWTVFEVR